MNLNLWFIQKTVQQLRWLGKLACKEMKISAKLFEVCARHRMEYRVTKCLSESNMFAQKLIDHFSN